MRYRIMTTKSDDTSSAKMVLFDKVAEEIIGKPIEKLLELYDKVDDKSKVLDILQKCVGKEYTFKIKVGVNIYGIEREFKCQKAISTKNIQETQEEGTLTSFTTSYFPSQETQTSIFSFSSFTLPDLFLLQPQFRFRILHPRRGLEKTIPRRIYT